MKNKIKTRTQPTKSVEKKKPNLLNPGHPVPFVDQHVGVFLEGGLGKAAVGDFLLHESDAADLATDDGVHVEQLVKLAHLEEEEGVQVLALQLPPLPENKMKLDRMKGEEKEGLSGFIYLWAGVCWARKDWGT